MKILKNGQGITDPSAELREYYNPLTGEAGGGRTESEFVRHDGTRLREVRVHQGLIVV